MAQRTSSRTNQGQDARVKLEDEQAQQQPKKLKEPHISTGWRTGKKKWFYNFLIFGSWFRNLPAKFRCVAAI